MTFANVILFIGLGLVSVFGVVVIVRHNRAISELTRVARTQGLSFSPGQTGFAVPRCFELFDERHERGVANLVYDVHDPKLSVFSYEWTDRPAGITAMGTPDRQERVYVRTCAVADVGWMWPHLQITHEGLKSKVANALGVRDLQTESEEFNRMFAVSSEDESFASAFLDARMIDFLVSTKGMFDVEVKNRWVLVTSKELRGRDVVAFFRLAQKLRQQIPRVTYLQWPLPPDR